MLNLFQHPSCLKPCGMGGREKQPVVYILASGHYGTLYIGVTSDLPARLWQHRNDALPGFSARYGIHRLIHYELFGEMAYAIAREKQMKRWHRQWKINLIEAENPDWRDLAVGLGLPPLAPCLRRDGC